MEASEIHEHKIDGVASVFFFARTYGDDCSSAAAYARARAKISGKDDTSLFRVTAPADGRQLPLSCAVRSPMPRRVRERIAWGGSDYSPTPNETGAITSHFREVAEAGALNSTASWGGVGGLALGPEGSRGPTCRPHG